MTGFNITGQDSFIFVAIEQGWFREASIEVKVVAGAGTQKNLTALTSGAAQFAVIDVTGGIIETMQGSRPKFKLFAALYQQSVSCIVAFPGTNIRQPTDLAGKTIGGTQGGVNVSLFPGYARNAGLDASAVKWQWLEPAGVRPAFLAGKVDASTEIVIGLPAVEAAARQAGRLGPGQSLTVLPYSDVLRDLFGNALGATDKLVADNPELVICFRDAALRGMAWTIDHPAEAGQIMAKHNKAYKPDVAEAEVRQTISYVRGGEERIGFIDKTRMTRSIALIQGLGLVQPGVTAEQIVDFNLAPGR
ncbi:ABC transporter substrate-binding protein [Virgisporangium aurantiacum]|uniref:ABC transporter substrate-binding protein n=1 Tax=Virgisporangium aurantiacum TaxID=175570 RepID=UPI0019513286|nr:ABC transporter substrate-binding protein [Virgisporangium aurantiacum]